MSQDKNHVIIFDTTLRDGEQSPGATMNLPEKLEVARALADLGVNVIEAGFPVASPGDFEEVKTIAREVQGPTICGLARCTENDIKTAFEALRDAEKKRLHLFLATSPIHRQYKLKMDRDEVVRRAVEGVKLARGLCEDVEFSCEDAARTELDFLVEVAEAVIDAGATTVNLPDTVGYSLPEVYAAMIRHVKQNVRNIDKAIISVHCHNDLGLAVANTISALEAGARQVECTINGIGERAGNAALEEVVMALRTRHDYLKLDTDIKTQRLYPTSRLVSNVTGIHVQRNKAIVGQNAFAHESGIHQHGMLQHASTYEIMRPQDVGMPQMQLVLGKHSGRHALRQRVETLGYQLDDAHMLRLFEEFKALADKKKEVYEADLESLIEGHLGSQSTQKQWKLVTVSSTSGSGVQPTATVCLERADGACFTQSASGAGPLDAIFNAIVRITELPMALRDYQLRSVSVGADSQGEAKVQVECAEKMFTGRATHIDVTEASAQAFIITVNRALMEKRSVENNKAGTKSA